MRRRLRRGQRGQGSTEQHERWLITYADLITLLLIFFVILYSISQLDLQKYTQLADQLHLQFESHDGVLEGHRGIAGDLKPGDNEGPDHGEGQLSEAELAAQREEGLQSLFKVIQSYVAEHGLEDSIQVVDRPEGIAITLKDLFLFDLGKAELKPASEPLLTQLASLFPQLDTKISIEGHTDDIPLATGSLYVDNWGLSAARALSVLRYFIDDADLDPNQFIIAGYADTEPIATNDTEANRQKNRRVEIVVLRTVH